jgi:hypothetical protein
VPVGQSVHQTTTAPQNRVLLKSQSNRPMLTLDFETEYHWGALMVKLVPMFCMDVYKASDDELVWVYDVSKPKDGYHVPARNLSTYSY